MLFRSTNFYVLGSDSTSGNTNSGTTYTVTISDTAGTSQYYNVYADNANGRSLASAATATVTTLSPSFFSPPLFFAPPLFFNPPAFFSPPTFCIDQNTSIAIINKDNSIGYKMAKDIVVGDKIWSVAWDGLDNEFNLDPYTWSSESIENINFVESEITNIIESVKDITMIINDDQDKRFSLEQTEIGRAHV